MENLREVILSEFEVSKKTDPFKRDLLKVLISEMIREEKADKPIDHSININLGRLVKKFIENAKEVNSEESRKEISILETYLVYLPKMLSREEIVVKVKEIIVEKGFTGMKDMGSLMKEFNGRYVGMSEGKVLSEVVKESLLNIS